LPSFLVIKLRLNAGASVNSVKPVVEVTRPTPSGMSRFPKVKAKGNGKAPQAGLFEGGASIEAPQLLGPNAKRWRQA
jgi:hypothetical protein